MADLERPTTPEQKEKPEVLYHASKTSGIKEFIPNRGNFRDEDEGPVIFSTPSKALASMFLVEGHGDHWTRIGFYSGIPVMIINAERNAFIENDKGGTLYTFSSENFDFDPNKGMGDKEWTSHVPVVPTSETNFQSSLDTMIENGVQVYFVDKKTFDEINQDFVNKYSSKVV